ncbi:hypothetical protein T4B_99 [Trichinella pseudospiralis]|uniref:Uncharacterized protein n=1 Tax=Trichinella pseudospiralis TaxID=6337 RepID=A0A0V1GIP3_TRIPS|nr:hypothetical protein T4B_11040 [Trichinella pseudospiralis]KRY98116.1 hypothetical protein T4B_99 [Trichinella pseudospiralis]
MNVNKYPYKSDVLTITAVSLGQLLAQCTLICTLCKSAQTSRSTNSGIRTSGRLHCQLQ